MAEGQRNLISVTVKSTKDKKTVEIGEDAEIKEVCFRRVTHRPFLSHQIVQANAKADHPICFPRRTPAFT